jgi:hypothetical protein
MTTMHGDRNWKIQVFGRGPGQTLIAPSCYLNGGV